RFSKNESLSGESGASEIVRFVFESFHQGPVTSWPPASNRSIRDSQSLGPEKRRDLAPLKSAIQRRRSSHLEEIRRPQVASVSCLRLSSRHIDWHLPRYDELLRKAYPELAIFSAAEALGTRCRWPPDRQDCGEPARLC